MAQDFGDEVGDRLERAIMRLLGDATRTAWRHYLDDRNRQSQKEFHEQNFRDKGYGSENASAAATAQAQREQVCVPFGSEKDAAYFAQVCRENGTYVNAFAGRSGEGYIQFAADDLTLIQRNVPQFSEVMTRLTNERVAAALEKTKPLTGRQIERLSEIKDFPELPKSQHPFDVRKDTEKASPIHAAEKNHTERIADEVRDARAQCQDFKDFQRKLAQKGIGVTTTKNGEAMFYEARMDENGQLLPFGTDEQGRRDWAVGAQTLKKNWGVDATHDSFVTDTSVSQQQRGRDQMRSSDGALDTDGSTPSLDQGIASHDGMDTDATTLRLEREQNGTDIAPSKVRAEEAPSLESAARESRAASKQLERESGSIGREMGFSDKLNPVR